MTLDFLARPHAGNSEGRGVTDRHFLQETPVLLIAQGAFLQELFI